jgi:hypothetical protein
MISQISSSSKIYDAVYRAEEIIDAEKKEALKWITDIIENPDRLKQEECEICNSSTKKLEQHHVRGHKHGNECITVCRECHEILTNNQRLWDRSWLDPNAENKVAFLERGLIDICELKCNKTGKEIYRLIAEDLRGGFSYE